MLKIRLHGAFLLFLNVQDEFHVPLKCNGVRWKKKKSGNGALGFYISLRSISDPLSLWHQHPSLLPMWLSAAAASLCNLSSRVLTWDHSSGPLRSALQVWHWADQAKGFTSAGSDAQCCGTPGGTCIVLSCSTDKLSFLSTGVELRMGKWRENVNLGVKIDPSTGPELTTPTDQIHTNHTKVDQYHMTHTWQELAANTANTPNHNSKEQRCPVNVLSDQNLLQKKNQENVFLSVH